MQKSGRVNIRTLQGRIDWVQGMIEETYRQNGAINMIRSQQTSGFVNTQDDCGLGKILFNNIRNQIDYITFNKRLRNSITKVTGYLGADCNSDHVLVVRWFLLRLKKRVQSRNQNQISNSCTMRWSGTNLHQKRLTSQGNV